MDDVILIGYEIILRERATSELVKHIEADGTSEIETVLRKEGMLAESLFTDETGERDRLL